MRRDRLQVAPVSQHAEYSNSRRTMVIDTSQILSALVGERSGEPIALRSVSANHPDPVFELSKIFTVLGWNPFGFGKTRDTPRICAINEGTSRVNRSATLLPRGVRHPMQIRDP